MTTPFADGVTVARDTAHVAVVTMSRPPNNYFNVELLTELADTFEALDADPSCRAIVLQGAGRHFCAGAHLSRENDPVSSSGEDSNPLYDQAIRLASGLVPVVAAVRGAAVGGGLGLALIADFRVAATDARFAANFTQLGLHPGFGATVTLPAVVGQQRALELLYTGRRLSGTEAMAIGLCDRLVAPEALFEEALALAVAIAASAPLAVRATRATMRGDLPERLVKATRREHQAQWALRNSHDYAEGVQAYAQRRAPRFESR